MQKKKVTTIILIVIALVIILNIARMIFTKTSGKFSDYVPKKIALVEIYGPIYDSRKTVTLLEKYNDDKRIKAVVVRLDTPGGGVAASQEIYNAINKLKKDKKKVVVSMGSVAASGGYYIASAADKIYANPGTLTGSIGVIMEIPNVEELLKKIGVKFEVVKSGEYKDSGSPMRKMTEAEQKLFKEVINDVYEQFIEAIAQGRKEVFKEKLKAESNMDKISLDDIKIKIKSFSDGRILSGRQALNLGLVDELGDLNDAIEETAKLVGIEGKPDVITEKKRVTLKDYLSSYFGETIGFDFQRSPMLQFILK
ncbi:MAG: signal peptide peptidase SppA [Candidatus Firestonebacteria bacterium]